MLVLKIVKLLPLLVLVAAGCFVTAQFLRLVMLLPFSLFVAPALEQRGVRFTVTNLWLLGRAIDLTAVAGAVMMALYAWWRLNSRRTRS